MLAKTYANGAVETYIYDGKYRLKEYTSLSGGVTRYEYDVADRNTAVIDAFGNRTEYAYNSKSEMTSMKDAHGNTFRYEYDSNGNRTKVIMPDGSSVTSVYNVRNKIISQTDQNGYTKSYTYNGADWLTSVTDEEGGIWRYGYDSLGNLVSVKDALGNETRYEYDKAGRVVKTTNAAGKASNAVYDESGCMLSTTDFAGVATTFTYDDEDRVVRKESGSLWVSYDYTKDGKLQSATDASGVTRFTYDDMDGLIKVEYPGGEYISYTYDKSLRMTSLQTAHGSVVYGYDVLDRLTSAEDASGRTTYQYDAVGNRTMVTYPNGVSMVYEYDALNRLIRQDVKNSEGGTITSYNYTLGKFGERLKAEEPTRTVVYTYDKLYRLTSESITSGGTTTDMRYAYDAASNRLSKTVDGVATNYTYNELNQLISETGITYTYNDAGNLIRKAEFGKNTAFEYDAWNRLIKATITEMENTGAESYQYDALGNRVAKTTNGVTTRYLVDTNTAYAQVIAGFEGTGTLKAFYSRNGAEPISRLDRAGKTHYYVYDGHGDTRMLFDKDGIITDAYVFDAWGNLLSRTGDTDNPFLYCGEQFDALTGLYYLRARYMNPSTGTFISMDTYQGSVFDPISLHKYLYAHANPVMGKDPSGMMTLGEVVVALAISTILAGLASGLISWLHNFLITGKFSADAFWHGAAWGALFGFSFTALSLTGLAWAAFIVKFASLFFILAAFGVAIEDFINGDIRAGIFMVLISILAAYLWVANFINPRRNGDTMNVTRYGRPGLRPRDWVMPGENTGINHFFSGKGQRGMGNQYAPRSTGETFNVPRSAVKWPTGWEFFKGIFGQRRYMPHDGFYFPDIPTTNVPPPTYDERR